MKLEAIFDQLLTRATRTERDQSANLPGGARLAVRVRAGQITLSIARRGKMVGATELHTFRGCCQVPETAERLPEAGQEEVTREDGTWHRVAFRWTEAS